MVTKKLTSKHSTSINLDIRPSDAHNKTPGSLNKFTEDSQNIPERNGDDTLAMAAAFANDYENFFNSSDMSPHWNQTLNLRQKGSPGPSADASSREVGRGDEEAD